MSDRIKYLIERLLKSSNDPSLDKETQELEEEAADALEKLQAERDAASAALDAKIDICGDERIHALQEQVRMLRRAGLKIKERLDRNGMSGRQLPEYPLLAEALAATEPKDADK